MRSSDRPSFPRRILRWTLGSLGILVSAFLLAATLLWLQTAPRKPGTVRQLIRAAQRQPTGLDRVRTNLWPRFLRKFDAFRPVDAGAVRWDACGRLGAFGPKASNAVPVLVSRLSDPSSPVALAAAIALVRIRNAEDKAFAQMLSMIGDPLLGSEARRDAAFAIAEYGVGDPAMVGHLTNALTSADRQLRLLAARSLIEMTTRTNQMEMERILLLSAELVSTAQPSDPILLASLVRKLGHVRSASGQTVRRLAEHLAHPHALVRLGATEALADLGSQAAAAVPLLMNAVKRVPDAVAPERDDQFPLAVRRMIDTPQRFPDAVAQSSDTAFGQRPAFDAEDIHRWAFFPAPFGSPDFLDGFVHVTFMRRRLFHALASIGAEARAAVPLLAQEYQNENSFTRFDAAVARWQIDGNCAEVLPIFLSGLRDGRRQIRAISVDRAKILAPQCPEVQRALEAIQSEQTRLRSRRNPP